MVSHKGLRLSQGKVHLQKSWLNTLMLGLAWILVAFIAGAAASKILAPMPVKGPALAAQADDSASALARLFGEANQGASIFSQEDIRLHGVMGGKKIGSVLVSIRMGPTRVLALGKQDPDGWRLESIDNNKVLLSLHGAPFELAIPKSKAALEISERSR